MSRVLYVSQYFVTSGQPGGVRHWQHTRALARAGHDVSVVTSYVQHKERTVPERYRGRNLYTHNAQVTLMRTTAEENERIGRWIGERLNRMEGPVRFLIPEGGVSLLDRPGGAFHDPAADAALFRALETTVRQTASRRLVRLPHEINDPAFAAALVAAFREVTR